MDKANKPVVHFSNVEYCEVGDSALVWPVDHPSPLVSNTKVARTSEVLTKVVNDLDQVLEFETMNILYKRLGQ